MKATVLPIPCVYHVTSMRIQMCFKLDLVSSHQGVIKKTRHTIMMGPASYCRFNDIASLERGHPYVPPGPLFPLPGNPGTLEPFFIFE